MDARREPLLDPAGVRALLSPSVIVGLTLALTAAILTLVYLFKLSGAGTATLARPPPAAAATGAAANALPAPLPEPVEFRCVDGLRVRKQGSSYTGDGRC